MTDPTQPRWTPAARAFIDDPSRYATIATIGEDGMPLQAVVWYGLDDQGIVINSRLGRRWPANLQRDPRISLSVSEADDYVAVRGRAEVIATGPQALADIQALARRYGGAPAGFDGQDRITFLVHPEHIATHGRIA
ncbi:MAG: TIGR03618 family F420-dependent PPOX class oxidoreductase [Candidatus Limnocylindrales bacterium]